LAGFYEIIAPKNKAVIEPKTGLSQVTRQMFGTDCMIGTVNRSLNIASQRVNPIEDFKAELLG